MYILIRFNLINPNYKHISSLKKRKFLMALRINENILENFVMPLIGVNLLTYAFMHLKYPKMEGMIIMIFLVCHWQC